MIRPNLPRPGEIVLDHSGHFVADADAARTALEKLGFTVTPLSAQVQPDPVTGEMKPTGTGNICVMLPEGYLEVLVHTADTAIGREFKAALDRRAGLHLVAFGLADAAARHAELVEAGVDMRPLVHFSREVETETGMETAAFTVARLPAGAMPEGRVQSLTHHNEAALWQPRWTAHANGAQSLDAIVLSSPDPRESAARFSRFLGRPVQKDGPGLRIPLDRGALEFLPEEAATALVGHAVDPGQSCFVGLRIGLADTAALPDDPRARWVDGSLVVPFDPTLGSGVWLFHPR
ncbi:VOC family protein [Chachezhania antarctica]|uniref:VOC family protein n=1 Tax=Chachezhania antarctica TaxID=2340860 RepID=UPI000EB47BA7|nr:VOC family protein [Chachezhania antarctica]|tara:strand:+ start:7993 stop:8865 length:873 start_codon:yes stop_codon:yes gene_type:complete